MKKSKEPKFLIIGAGPAGLQLGYFLHQKGLDYVVLEATDAPGSFFERYPRHRKMISINKVWTGYTPGEEVSLRYDWNSLISDDLKEMAVGQYTKSYFPDAGDYVRYLHDFAEKFKLNIQYNTRIEKITKGELFHAHDANGDIWSSPRLIVATGVTRPYLPVIPGIELAEHYMEFSLDPETYVDERILILGKGNSAFETADWLTPYAQVIHVCSPQSVKMAWSTHYIADLRAVNNNFMDTYIFKGQNSVLDADVDLIEKQGDEYLVHVTFTHASGQKGILSYDRVLACTGFRFDNSIFDDSCKPEMIIRNKLPAITSEWESTNVKNLFFAGTLMQMRDFHKTNSNVIHGFRFNLKAFSEILVSRFENQPLASKKLPLDTRLLTKHLIDRVSLGAAIFLQPGFLCDVMVINDNGEEVEYYEGLPVDYVHDSELGKNSHYYTITLEYGEIVGDPFRIDRDPDPEKAYLDAYLHPVIRRYSSSVVLCEHHMPEHLENDWRIDQFPGKTAMMRSWDYIGEKDPVAFRNIFSRNLQNFIEEDLKARLNN